MERKLYEYDYEKPELTDEFLEHHGILGQKWGRKNGPPYPLDSDVSTGRRLKKKSKGSLSDRHKAKKLKKNRVKSLKKARKVRAEKLQEKKQATKTKEEIIKTHDLKAMYENRDLFTTQEINDLNNRYTAVQNLKKNLAQEMNSQRTKGQKVKAWVKKTATEAGLNAAKKVVNASVDMAFKKLAQSSGNAILIKAANTKTKDQEQDDRIKALEKQKQKSSSEKKKK